MADSLVYDESQVEVLDLTRTLKENEKLKLQIIDNQRVAPLKIVGKIVLSRGATLDMLQVDLGRLDVDCRLQVEVLDDAEFNSTVCAMCQGNEHKRYAIDVVHIGHRSKSLTSMRGVCSDTSKMEFLGSSDIKRGAYKTHTRQEGKIINLSGRAKCTVSPALLIAEEDVYASHGATMGSVPTADMFYIMSRGLSKKTAERLITVGYLKPGCQMIADEKARDLAISMLENEI